MPRDVVILCNGASRPQVLQGESPHVKRLDYRAGEPCDQRVRIKVPRFTEQLLHLPPRLLDLVEIAAYVYAADRLYKRGSTRQVEFEGWSRRFRFIVRVADHEFWSDPTVGQELGRLLEFLAGDESYEFEFQPGFDRHPTSLFDREDHPEIMRTPEVEVALFSGGLDSTAGALELLSTTDKGVCLVSHKSGSTAIKRTQVALVAELRRRFPDRVRHVEFESGLSGINRAPEESQRARFFLYASIAVAVAKACGQNRVTAFENGVTSIHLRKRQDHLNSRSTRTTHPISMRRLKNLLERVLDAPLALETPYFWMTKTDVVRRLADHGGAALFSSTVSCGKTIRQGNETHCGGCSQCVDRRVAAHAAGLAEQDDEGLYHLDFARGAIPDEDGEARTVLNDFFFQAAQFKNATEDGFAEDRLGELSDVAEGFPDDDPEEVLSKAFALCKRHGEQAFAGYDSMRAIHGDPSRPRDPRSLYAMVDGGVHLRPPEEVVADGLAKLLREGIRTAFQRRRPDHENVLNDEIEALLGAARVASTREYPHIPFATKQSVPDHALDGCGVLVEGKVVSKTRGGVRTANNEMAADLVLYKTPSLIFFVVYDPDGMIKRDTEFIEDFEKHGRCKVCIVR